MATGISCPAVSNGHSKQVIMALDILDECPHPVSAVAGGPRGTDGLTVGDTIRIHFSADTDTPILSSLSLGL